MSSVRAIATRCFCPPESVTPLSPTSASRPSGNVSMKSHSAATRAASSTSSRVASGRPYLMFSASDAEKRYVSCSTSPTCLRSESNRSSRTSSPSTSTRPSVAS